MAARNFVPRCTIYILISSISMCNRNRYIHSEKHILVNVSAKAYIYIYMNIQQLASNQDFSFFRCSGKNFIFSGKIEKIKMHHSLNSNHGSPAFRASALTFRLWNIIYLIFHISRRVALQPELFYKGPST